MCLSKDLDYGYHDAQVMPLSSDVAVGLSLEAVAKWPV